MNLFYRDSSRVREVFPFTVQLERKLANFPTNEFLINCLKAEVLEIFRRLRDGPLITD